MGNQRVDVSSMYFEQGELGELGYLGQKIQNEQIALLKKRVL